MIVESLIIYIYVYIMAIYIYIYTELYKLLMKFTLCYLR